MPVVMFSLQSSIFNPRSSIFVRPSTQGGFVDRAGEGNATLSPAFSILSAFNSIGKIYKLIAKAFSAAG
jgi:hypothetical protein